MNTISKEEQEALQKAYKKEKEGAVKIRLLAMICLYIHHMSIPEICNLLLLSSETVYAYKRKYDEGKIEKLKVIKFSTGRPSKLTDEQLEILKKEVATKMYLTSKEVCNFVQKKLGTSYNPNAMSGLLSRMGFTYKKAKGVPCKASKEKQEVYLKEILEPAIERSSDRNPVYFSDATHMRYNSTLAYGWVLKGKNKEIRQNTGRKTIHINGAYCDHNKDVIYRKEERVNTDAMVGLMQDIREKHERSITVTVFLDNASYNRSKGVKEYANKNI